MGPTHRHNGRNTTAISCFSHEFGSADRFLVGFFCNLLELLPSPAPVSWDSLPGSFISVPSSPPKVCRRCVDGDQPVRQMSLMAARAEGYSFRITSRDTTATRESG